MILSIDIGIKNLGFCVINYTDSLKTMNISFDLFVIDDKKTQDIVKYRINKILQFFDKIPVENPCTVIIERQVNHNTIAMELMYSIATAASMKFGAENVIIFAPNKKFTFIKEDYITKNLQHKRKSKQLAESFLKNNYSEMYEEFKKFDKKDDISDALNQALVYIVENKLVKEDMLTLRNFYSL